MGEVRFTFTFASHPIKVNEYRFDPCVSICVLYATSHTHRNEVWRYDVKQFGTHRGRLVKFLFRGLPAGAALAAATIGIEMALGINQPHGHGHDDHHGGAEGAGHH